MKITKKTLAFTLLTEIGVISLCCKVAAMEPQGKATKKDSVEIISSEDELQGAKSNKEDSAEIVSFEDELQEAKSNKEDSAEIVNSEDKPQEAKSDTENSFESIEEWGNLHKAQNGKTDHGKNLQRFKSDIPSPTKPLYEDQIQPKPHEEHKAAEEVEVIENKEKTNHSKIQSKEKENVERKLKRFPVRGNRNLLCSGVKPIRDLRHFELNPGKSFSETAVEKGMASIKESVKETVAVGKQLVNSSSLLFGKEYGGNFDENLSVVLCNSTLFNTWSFVKTDALKLWQVKNPSFNFRAQDYILLSNELKNFALVPQSVHLLLSSNQEKRQEYAEKNAAALVLVNI